MNLSIIGGISIKYPIIVLDLDGTLLNADKQISKRNYEAMMTCSKHGIRFIYATARPPRAVRLLLPEELLYSGSFIYYNGAYIHCNYTGIQQYEHIDPAITAELIDYGMQINNELGLSLEVEDQWISLKKYDYTTLMRVKENPTIKSLEELKGIAATKILFTGFKDIDFFKEKFASRLNVLVTDGGNLVQISSIKSSKENALRILCKAMKIKLENVMVFGDDFNDIGLFEICGWPVAMGNAIEELKILSKEITDTNESDGVAKVLERILI
ncbi:HAD family hydrolase [Paenibacillus sp. F6_3S_P_1C]|uniref:HAD family hydrolase n=1 Tax=Paenibacillus vandeheii TaxID=3035917 RepID=A0ABT8JDZ0_9BACL|nr:HAD family hydrolase [Paenibacillus vandeheii]